MWRASIIAFCLTMFLPELAFPQPPRPLLRVRADYVQYATGTKSYNDDLVVSLNRQVAATLVLKVPFNSVSPFWRTRSFLVTSPAAALDQLRQALVEYRVGQQVNCTLPPAMTQPIAGYYDITWYGAVRRKQFLVTVAGRDRTCPPEMAPLINAIVAFARSSGVEGFGIPLQD